MVALHSQFVSAAHSQLQIGQPSSYNNKSGLIRSTAHWIVSKCTVLHAQLQKLFNYTSQLRNSCDAANTILISIIASISPDSDLFGGASAALCLRSKWRHTESFSSNTVEMCVPITQVPEMLEACRLFANVSYTLQTVVTNIQGPFRCTHTMPSQAVSLFVK